MNWTGLNSPPASGSCIRLTVSRNSPSAQLPSQNPCSRIEALIAASMTRSSWVSSCSYPVGIGTSFLGRCRQPARPAAARNSGGYHLRVDTRTVGVEEELLVVDPSTRAVTSRAPEVLREYSHHHGDDPGLSQELFRHQLETRTEPAHAVDDVVAQVVEGRRRAADAAAARDLAVAACATIPMEFDAPEVSADDRYRDMVETYGAVARLAGTCGMHVHVAIGSEEEGVGCLDRIAPWLPVLLAVSSNSPYAD